MSDYKEKSLEDFEKEFDDHKKSLFWAKVKNAINILPQSSIKVADGPDISTITEHIAFVIDDKVVEIMHCQPKMAAILLSEPKIIKIEDGDFAKPGWEYKDGKFISPQGNSGQQQGSQEEKDTLPTFKEYIENVGKPKLLTFKQYIESKK